MIAPKQEREVPEIHRMIAPKQEREVPEIHRMLHLSKREKCQRSIE